MALAGVGTVSKGEGGCRYWDCFGCRVGVAVRFRVGLGSVLIKGLSGVGQLVERCIEKDVSVGCVGDD